MFVFLPDSGFPNLPAFTALPTAEQSTAGDGLGFAFGGRFACIDLDNCYDSCGHLADWAQMLPMLIAGKTWIEISPRIS